jgi:integrase/recombinase XerD
MKALLSQPDISRPTGIRDRAVLEVFYSTGARLEELCGMNVHDADLKQGRIRITGKGNKERAVPMGRQAVYWTERYLKDVRPGFLRKRPDEPALWLGVAGKRINPLIVERFIRRYGEKAGIKHPVTPHTLRRACATHMLRGGAHPVQIQMLLGHASLRILSRYLKVTITDMMKTHARGKPGK